MTAMRSPKQATVAVHRLRVLPTARSRLRRRTRTQPEAARAQSRALSHARTDADEHRAVQAGELALAPAYSLRQDHGDRRRPGQRQEHDRARSRGTVDDRTADARLRTGRLCAPASGASCFPSKMTRQTRLRPRLEAAGAEPGHGGHPHYPRRRSRIAPGAGPTISRRSRQGLLENGGETA